MQIRLKSECTDAIYTWISQHEFLTWHLGGVHVCVFVEIYSATSSPAAVHGLRVATLQKTLENIKNISFTNQIDL
jgi:hypothetical protein